MSNDNEQTIDTILEAYKHFIWADITGRGKQGLDKSEVKQAILDLLLALPELQEEKQQHHITPILNSQVREVRHAITQALGGNDNGKS